VILMSVIAGLILRRFVFMSSAWPVVGFMGLDVALIWWPGANFADARRAEHIEITSDGLVPGALPQAGLPRTAVAPLGAG
jgi:uncharacterized membrane protein